MMIKLKSQTTYSKFITLLDVIFTKEIGWMARLTGMVIIATQMALHIKDFGWQTDSMEKVWRLGQMDPSTKVPILLERSMVTLGSLFGLIIQSMRDTSETTI